LLAREERVGLTNDPFTIEAIHWAEDRADANIEAAMKNCGEKDDNKQANKLIFFSQWSCLSHTAPQQSTMTKQPTGMPLRKTQSH
jgi:hypothetical protein